MSLFVESVCKIDGDPLCDRLAWSTSDQIAAMIVNTIDENDRESSSVMFMNNEGVLLKQSSITHEREATVLDWQPNGRLLAIGWKDGMISVWMVDGTTRPSSTFSNTSQHNGAITMVKWNPSGKKLITGDKKGVLTVWSVDTRGTLSLSCQYRKQGAIRTAVFCPIVRLIPKAGSSGKGGDKKKKQQEAIAKQLYSPPFFFGTEKGALVYADDMGFCTDVQQLSSAIDALLFFEETSKLVVITRSLMLMQYLVAEDGHVNRVSHGKLSAQAELAEKGLRSLNWVGPGLLAAATNEKMIRLYDLATDETYNLSLSVLGDMVDRNDQVLTMAFSPIDRYLAVGTRGGLLVIWRYIGPVRDLRGSTDGKVAASSPSDWELHYKVALPSLVHHLEWSSGQGTLGVVLEYNVLVLSEAVLHSVCCGDLAVLQSNASEIAINVGASTCHMVDTRMIVKGIATSRSCLVVWSGKGARVYTVDLSDGRSEAFDPFATTAQSIAIGDSTHLVEAVLFLAEGANISVANFKGVRKGTISFSEGEGQPELIDIKGKYLAAITTKGILKVFDVSQPTKPKSMGSACNFFASESTTTVEGRRIRCIRVNSEGTRVAVIVDKIKGALKVRHPDPKLYVYDRNKGGVITYDFSLQMKCPFAMEWDDSDDRLIAVEAKRDRSVTTTNPTGPTASAGDGTVSTVSAPSATDIEAEHDVEIVMLFATSEHGILLQDSFPRKYPYGSLLGVSVPRVLFRSAPPVLADGDDPEVYAKISAENSCKVFAKVMRDFVGLDGVMDEQAKLALIEFSFNVTLGKLDEAYRSVKAIDSPSIWENMAHMCVKTKRLDVAEVCLGNMGHARGAAALRQAKEDPFATLESKIGIVAIQLGLLDDAARLFRECGRFDLLNLLYQSTGLWDKAILTASNNDRIHLKSTHFNYAKFLESIGDTAGAIEHYESSQSNRTEVPRMMYKFDFMDELETYIQKSTDPVLLKWWAAYLESKEMYDRAKKYYSKACDFLSLVRISCFQGDMSSAAGIVMESEDKAAAYYFARQLEAKGDLNQAITYYASSGCYNHAIRLAKVNHMDTDMMRFALKAAPTLMLECAAYFEDKNEYEKSIQLYHKGGDLGKAMDLCFKGAEALNVTVKGRSKPDTSRSQGIFEMMNEIAADLGVGTSPQTLARCAEFLMQHRQFERAIDLYILAKRFPQAIEMCMVNNITITDDMAEKLSPKVSPDLDEATSKDTLKLLAKALKTQGSYALASRKYTQAGDRLRAIKCLVRSGDTRAVIQFATVTRNPEIYKLAANYLQQMNWRESADIMKAIISFYTKAKSFEQLAGFYDACAQVEIDEYRDYDKAQAALREAINHLKKAESRQAEQMADTIARRIGIIETYCNIRKLATRSPEEMVSMCQELLRNRDLEEAVRAGDCYALLIEHFYSQRSYEDAYKYMQEMERRGVEIGPYIDASIIADVNKKLGIAPAKASAPEAKKQSSQSQSQSQTVRSESKKSSNGGSNEEADVADEDEVDEEIAEELDEDSPKKTQKPSQRGYAQQRYPPRK